MRSDSMRIYCHDKKKKEGENGSVVTCLDYNESSSLSGSEEVGKGRGHNSRCLREEKKELRAEGIRKQGKLQRFAAGSASRIKFRRTDKVFVLGRTSPEGEQGRSEKNSPRKKKTQERRDVGNLSREAGNGGEAPYHTRDSQAGKNRESGIADAEEGGSMK